MARADYTAFISYSWESEAHKDWVRDLATRLRADGVDVSLDQWDLAPGDQLTGYMESAIRENDYVLVVCTPHYKERSDQRQGGVGYEGDIMTAEVHSRQNHKKFIPLLRNGNWETASPTWLSGKYYLDFSGNTASDTAYGDLLNTVTGARESAPPIGTTERLRAARPAKSAQRASLAGAEPSDPTELRITGVVVDDVSEPRLDDTPGSALYSVPFRLSSMPPRGWAEIFVETWNHPPRYTSMHRPGIAIVRGDRVILDGTTIEEVEKYHRETLILSVNRTNEVYTERLEQARIQREREAAQTTKHVDAVRDVAGRLKFDD